MTAGDGTASVSGIAWGDRPGAALIQIKASRKGESGAAVVTVELTPGTGEIRTISSRSGKGKWVLVAVAAGAALAGAAFAGGKGATAGSTGAVLVAAPPPPTVGTPIISIGKP
jgi:predicted phage tail protein